MDGRNYGSGFSSWGGSANNRGSNNFDLYGGGFKDSMSGLGGYGGGGQMKRGLSGGSMTGADNVIAKINQRLDMLTQLEGGMKSSGGRTDRFEQYKSYDSQPSSLTSSGDLYRSGGGSSYGFGDGRGDSMLMGQRGSSGFGGGFGLGGGGGFGSSSSSYGVAKMRPDMRDSFSGGLGGGSGGGGQGWAGAGRRSPRGGGNAGGQGNGGGFGGRRSDPTPMGGGGGGRGGGFGLSHHSPGGGRGKLPSLLSNRMYPESGGFHQGSPQGPRNFPGRNFGGGPQAGHQRGRKRVNRGKPQREIMKNAPNAMKKRKPTTPAADEPESKLNKTETAGTEATQESIEKNGEAKEANTADESNAPNAEGETAPPVQEENSKSKKKPQGKWTPTHGQERNPKLRRKRGYVERAMFACLLCKFRSFYKEDLMTHLESSFHQAHLKFVISRMSKPTTDFLQEYILDKCKKTEQRTQLLSNHSASICQFYKDQDLTREIGMEHFMKKVEAAHCAACDVFIPQQHHLIQEHLRSPDHNYNRKGMMEQSKRDSLSVARSILNHKVIGQKLESFLKGENPFADNQEDQDPEDSLNMEVSELELTNDNQAEAEAEVEPTEVKAEPTEAEAEVEPTEDEVPEEKIEAEPEGEILSEAVEGDRTEGEVGQEAVDGDGMEGEVGQEAVDGDGMEGEVGQEAVDGDGTEGEVEQETLDADETEGEVEAVKGEAVEGDRTEEENLEEDLGVEGVVEQGEHDDEADEEGFEIGDEEGCEDEEGVEHILDEDEEDEGIVATEVEDELKNDYDDDDGVVVLD